MDIADLIPVSWTINQLISYNSTISLWVLSIIKGERFCPHRGGDWQEITEMFSARSNFATVLLDDMIFVIGGFNGESFIIFYPKRQIYWFVMDELLLCPLFLHRIHDNSARGVLRWRYIRVVRRSANELEPLSAERVRAGRAAQRALLLLPGEGGARRRRWPGTSLKPRPLYSSAIRFDVKITTGYFYKIKKNVKV